MQEIDFYKTLEKVSEGAIYKEKGSKFLGYAYPIKSEEEVAPILLKLKESHHKARHWCYAWRLGVENARFRANDDGEPNNSAGQPIYGQILSYALTDVLIVVVRYFGGTKLGVGGLIGAYKTAASFTLETSKIITKTIDVYFELQFDYANMNKVMRLIKENNIKIQSQKMEIDCAFKIYVRKKEAQKTKIAFENLRCVKIKEIH